jgi:hypothetical protein
MKTQNLGIDVSNLQNVEAIVLKNVANKINEIENSFEPVPESVTQLSEFDGGETQKQYDEAMGWVFQNLLHKLSIVVEAEIIARLEEQYFTCGIKGILGEVLTPIFEKQYNW